MEIVNTNACQFSEIVDDNSKLKYYKVVCLIEYKNVNPFSLLTTLRTRMESISVFATSPEKAAEVVKNNLNKSYFVDIDNPDYSFKDPVLTDILEIYNLTNFKSQHFLNKPLY